MSVLIHKLNELAKYLTQAGEYEAVDLIDTTTDRLTSLQNEVALADLTLDYLSLAQPEFCSARCPSVGREGEPIPHLSECESMRSLLAADNAALKAPRS